MKTKERGFSLLELAIIILILGLLSTFVWRFLMARLQKKESVTAHSLLERADWALTGFILTNHRLPCPDTDENGTEDPCIGTTGVGRLPYLTLGMADTRAGAIRYGVLNRDASVLDPEVVVGDPAPPLERSANLTRPMDRFYPLVLSLGSADPLDAFPKLPSMTTTLPLAAPRPLYPPLASNILPPNPPNGIDFCQALRVSEDPAPVPAEVGAYAHIATPTGPAARQIAYALALPGALDVDGNGNLFDGAQTSERAFDPPQGAKTHLNDDRVRAVGLGVLWNRLGCGEAIAAVGHAQPNAATAAVMLYRGLYDYEQVLEQAVELAKANEIVAASGILGGVGAVMDATSATLYAAGDAAKTPAGAASVVAVALVVASATTTMALAVETMDIATETLNMAKRRYEFIKQLTASARNDFALDNGTGKGSVTQRVVDHDAKGLYQGK
jgi:preprotein translocase subunit YajC